MGFECWDRAEMSRVLAAPKDAQGYSLQWHDVRVGDQIVRRNLLEVGLRMDDPPCSGLLLLSGRWMSGSNIQVMLMVKDGGSCETIARLCLCHLHPTIHWHWYAKPNHPFGPSESVAQPPAIVDHETMVREVFVPRMNIWNFREELR